MGAKIFNRTCIDRIVNTDWCLSLQYPNKWIIKACVALCGNYNRVCHCIVISLLNIPFAVGLARDETQRLHLYRVHKKSYAPPRPYRKCVGPFTVKFSESRFIISNVSNTLVRSHVILHTDTRIRANQWVPRWFPVENARAPTCDAQSEP